MYQVYWNIEDGPCWTPILQIEVTREEARAIAGLMKSLRPDRRWGTGPKDRNGIEAESMKIYITPAMIKEMNR